MNTLLREVGALLQQFTQSDWRDIHIRTERYSLFIAKPGGAANPMIGTSTLKSPVKPKQDRVTSTVVAPHLGTLVSILGAGGEVTPGAVVSRIEVLGEITDIVSDQTGLVELPLAVVGALVEYETPLLTIVPQRTP